jgi:hypothetical protein
MKMLLRSKLALFLLLAVLGAPALVGRAAAAGMDGRDNANDRASAKVPVTAPLDIAILVQDDLVSRVGSELGVTREFIQQLPPGSHVMIGYVTAGSLQVRQSFTEDLDRAANALRAPRGTESAAPYNPYVEVVEALKLFDSSSRPKAILLISDGLDDSRGFDVSSTIESIDLEHAVREANKRNVNIYAFYAPTVGRTSHSYRAAGLGQSSLNKLSNETGGKAFFQGSSFVTFDSYFDRLRRELNEQSGA